MTLELDIKLTRDGDMIIVTVSGELDDYNAPKLNDTFTDVIDNQQVFKLIVNLEDTTYVDSVGLGTIAIAAKKVARSNGALNIVCTKPQVVKLLDASGMVSMIKRNIGLFEDVEQAKASMQ